MPIEFALKDNVGVFTTIGDVEYTEGLKVLESGLNAIQSASPSARILFDITQIREKRSYEEIYNIASYIKPRFTSAKVAFVADGEHYVALSRAASAFVGGDKIQSRIFRDFGEALAWLKQ